jgi:hypothetical protein
LSDLLERHLLVLALILERWLRLHSDPDLALWCLLLDR